MVVALWQHPLCKTITDEALSTRNSLWAWTLPSNVSHLKCYVATTSLTFYWSTVHSVPTPWLLLNTSLNRINLFILFISSFSVIWLWTLNLLCTHLYFLWLKLVNFEWHLIGNVWNWLIVCSVRMIYKCFCFYVISLILSICKFY